MRLVCPACGAAASAEAWGNDAATRRFMEALTRLPAPVQARALPYLGLFRRGEKGLAWPRAERLLASLLELVSPGRVRWEGGEDRPAPPDLWAKALDAVLDRRPQGLSNHNYLRHVAWEMASELAAREERRREAEKAWRPTPPGADPPSEEDLVDIRGMMKDFLGKFGRPR